MKRWRTSNGCVLIQVDKENFILLDKNNQSIKDYSSRSFSLEYDLYSWCYEIREGAFIEITKVTGTEGYRQKESVQLEGLHDLLEMEPPTSKEIVLILNNREKKRNISETTIQTKTLSLATPIQVPSGNEHQRKRLASRIVRFDDKLSGAVLNLLNRLESLHHRLSSNAALELEHTVQILNTVGAFVTSDPQRPLPNRPLVKIGYTESFPTATEIVLKLLIEPRSKLERLIKIELNPKIQHIIATLDITEQLAHQLINAAKLQSYIDANHTSRCYLQATEILITASEHLARVCQYVLLEHPKP